MKIKLSPTEEYSIVIPEEVSADQFLGLLSRMQAISRVINRDVAISLNSPVSISKPSLRLSQESINAVPLLLSKIVRGKHTDFKAGVTREQAIERLNHVYTLPSKEERLQYLMSVGWASGRTGYNQVVDNVMKAWAISPSEVKRVKLHKGWRVR